MKSLKKNQINDLILEIYVEITILVVITVHASQVPFTCSETLMFQLMLSIKKIKSGRLIISKHLAVLFEPFQRIKLLAASAE